ncbi:MAG: hydroxymethylpyrimidine/phosphomethylpyrimidine kinase [Acidimicrobiaceae bacterium]|nr:hydroxymethylpyrimidine/phosphomethylpyrimidine kinase [Acidimicrobiaceae bacterium]
MGLIRPVALSIAGSDSSGGAGVVADLKTFEALGVWGAVALTAVTAQNSLGVSATHLVPPEVIRAQIAAVAGDVVVGAAKTGMLGSAAGVRAAADGIRDAGIALVVVDPVLISKHGDALLAGDALEVLRAVLLPLATVVTPNLAEAAALVGFPVEDRGAMVAAAGELRRAGPEVVLVKGGHLADEGSSPDLVCGPDGLQWLEGPRRATVHTHGTGCVLSAAIAAYLALGRSPQQACAEGKRFVSLAIAAGGPRGRGIGPVDPGSLARARQAP